ncbi:MAG: Crp/Fnr family transcriptional regulator [Saprospiraceae bacterium]
MKQLNKKEYYLNSREIQKEMGFVHSGLLRSYYVDKEGKEITISFIDQNTYASDYPSFLRQIPSKYYIVSLEPSIVVNLPYAKIQEAYKKFKNFEEYGRRVAEAILLKKQDRLESFLFEDAEERYLRFIDQNPDLINRISLSHLSSYLGIERQSLSRIRKKLSQK